MKRILFVLAACVGLASPGWAAITEVASAEVCWRHTNGGVPVESPPIDTTGANFLTAVISSDAGSAIETLSDELNGSPSGHTWQTLTETNTGLVRVQIAYVENATTSGTHTFILNSNSGKFSQACVKAWSWVKTSASFDVQAGNSALGAASIQVTLPTPSEGSELVILGVSSHGGSITFTVNSGYDAMIQPVTPSYGLGLSWRIKTTAAADAPTITPNTTASMGVRIASFKQHVVGGGGSSVAPIGTFNQLGVGR